MKNTENPITFWYEKYSNKSEENFFLKLALIETKRELELFKLGYRTADSVIERINKVLENKETK